MRLFEEVGEDRGGDVLAYGAELRVREELDMRKKGLLESSRRELGSAKEYSSVKTETSG